MNIDMRTQQSTISEQVPRSRLTEGAIHFLTSPEVVKNGISPDQVEEILETVVDPLQKDFDATFERLFAQHRHSGSIGEVHLMMRAAETNMGRDKVHEQLGKVISAILPHITKDQLPRFVGMIEKYGAFVPPYLYTSVIFNKEVSTNAFVEQVHEMGEEALQHNDLHLTKVCEEIEALTWGESVDYDSKRKQLWFYDSSVPVDVNDLKHIRVVNPRGDIIAFAEDGEVLGEISKEELLDKRELDLDDFFPDVFPSIGYSGALETEHDAFVDNYDKFAQMIEKDWQVAPYRLSIEEQFNLFCILEASGSEKTDSIKDRVQRNGLPFLRALASLEGDRSMQDMLLYDVDVLRCELQAKMYRAYNGYAEVYRDFDRYLEKTVNVYKSEGQSYY